MDRNQDNQDVARDIKMLCSMHGIGSEDADLAIERRLGPYIRRVIQRVLRSGRAVSPFERRILAEASKLTRTEANETPSDRAALVGLLSSRICRALVPCLANGELPTRCAKDTVHSSELRTVF
jgi:hypothetical protein